MVCPYNPLPVTWTSLYPYHHLPIMTSSYDKSIKGLVCWLCKNPHSMIGPWNKTPLESRELGPIWKTENGPFQKVIGLCHHPTTPSSGNHNCHNGLHGEKKAHLREDTLGRTNQGEKGVWRGGPLGSCKSQPQPHGMNSAAPVDHHPLPSTPGHTITDTGKGLLHWFHGCFLADNRN